MISNLKNIMNDLIKSLLQRANSNGSRSTVLKPVLWVITIFSPSIITSTVFSYLWLTILLSVMLIIFCLFFMVVYSFCLLKNPDLLRSEKYHIDRLFLEQTSLNQTKNNGTFEVENIKKVSADDNNLLTGEILVKEEFLYKKDEE